MTEPGDSDEREADAVADEIVSGGVVRRKISSGAGGGIQVSPQVEGRILQPGGGWSMPSSIRGMMEQGFGRDFSSVRLHTDSDAAAMSASISARAFTHGQDIFFNSGQYSPDTTEGRRLIAHELTHVVQGGGKVARQEITHTEDDDQYDIIRTIESNHLLDGKKNKDYELFTNMVVNNLDESHFYDFLIRNYQSFVYLLSNAPDQFMVVYEKYRRSFIRLRTESDSSHKIFMIIVHGLDGEGYGYLNYRNLMLINGYTMDATLYGNPDELQPFQQASEKADNHSGKDSEDDDSVVKVIDEVFATFEEVVEITGDVDSIGPGVIGTVHDTIVHYYKKSKDFTDYGKGLFGDSKFLNSMTVVDTVVSPVVIYENCRDVRKDLAQIDLGNKEYYAQLFLDLSNAICNFLSWPPVVLTIAKFSKSAALSIDGFCSAWTAGTSIGDLLNRLVTLLPSGSMDYSYSYMYEAGPSAGL